MQGGELLRNQRRTRWTVIGPGKISPRAGKSGVLVKHLLKESNGLVHSLLGGRQDSVPGEKILLICT